MTKKEQQKRVILARRLLANGVPLEIDREKDDAGLLMRQIGALTESRAFDLKYGRSGYMVNVRITQGEFTIADAALELPWTDCGLSLIDDPLESGARYNRYFFPGNDSLAFERTAVINHWVNMERHFRRKKTIKGLLLWVGSEPIPDAFVHGVLFPASVIVLDQYANRYAFEVDLWTDRSERGTREKHVRKSRPRLFSQRDPSPVHSRLETDPIAVGVASPTD